METKGWKASHRACVCLGEKGKGELCVRERRRRDGRWVGGAGSVVGKLSCNASDLSHMCVGADGGARSP